jgi:LacI family transcriptional regulator
MRASATVAGDRVGVDEEDGSYEAVTHLLRLGRRRIAMINGVEHVSTSRRRLVGYRTALREAHIAFDAALVAPGDFRVESGYAAAMTLLKRKPDAFFVANYLMAVGLMRALRQHQLRCPDDIALVTCDDYPWLDSFHPRLTTVSQPKYELGQAGARALLERLDPEARLGKRARTITLKTSLCLRESCGYERRAARRA